MPPLDGTPGSDLLSHAVTSAVPSALEGFTAVFGMGTGVAPPESPPGMVELTHSNFSPDRPHESDYCTSRDGLRSTAPETGHGIGTTGSIQLLLEASPRPISTARLSLSALHLRPINLVVSQGTYPLDAVGDLILGWVSRLDAFSAYPVRT
jgi:hypothetical protein